MQKEQLISFVKKSGRRYKKNVSPYEVYKSIKGNELLRTLFGKVLSGKDVILYCFLMNKLHSNLDLNAQYDIINYYLTGFQISYVDEHDPNMDCDNCSGEGGYTCSDCGGSGEVNCTECNGNGSVSCPDCDGEDEDGDTCYNCNGKGEIECTECYGDGSVRCEDCEGTGKYDCSECDGLGEKVGYDNVKLEKMKYLTYHPEFITKLEGMDEGEIIDDYTYKKYVLSDYTILIETREYYTDDKIYTEVEDGTYVFDTELRNPKLEINSAGKISMRWQSEF